MNIDKLNQDIIAILDNKIALANLDYSSPDYDDLEESLHDKEDALMKDFGPYLEEALHEVHDEFCPDTDVLLPIAYLPRAAKKEGTDYSVTIADGVYVEVDDYASEETKLVILPNPTRIELMVDADQREVVWKAE
ncbi:hypothetical protein [Fulvivirga lutimaris]|uniref:hypothetical protein n=1 Tax=Fulvivirga lutimaris TaxID=1819566 RepID=UPI0012BC025A|nr:hypothetical protein [Fulvivirga lutimaris]MTI39249.1 hypothetical protein [Fulvivirga lutimaris]